MDNNKNNDLPENAKRIFQGKIFEVWQWEQKMFDGSVETFERLKRPDSVIVIAVVGDKIILQEQKQPDTNTFTSFPGGRNDQNEEDIIAAKRELLEETGYASSDVFSWKKFRPVSKIEWWVNYFIARNCKKTQEPKLDAGEKVKNKLISFDELLMLSENKTFRDKELINVLYYLRLHPEEKDKFKKLLFG